MTLARPDIALSTKHDVIFKRKQERNAYFLGEIGHTSSHLPSGGPRTDGWGNRKRANITEDKVENCISWMLRFLELRGRLELVQHACRAAQQTSGVYHLDFATHVSKTGLDPRRQDFSHKCA